MIATDSVSKREHSCVVGNQHEGIFSSSVGNVRKAKSAALARRHSMTLFLGTLEGREIKRSRGWRDGSEVNSTGRTQAQLLAPL